MRWIPRESNQQMDEWSIGRNDQGKTRLPASRGQQSAAQRSTSVEPERDATPSVSPDSRPAHSPSASDGASTFNCWVIPPVFLHPTYREESVATGVPVTSHQSSHRPALLAEQVLDPQADEVPSSRTMTVNVDGHQWAQLVLYLN